MKALLIGGPEDGRTIEGVKIRGTNIAVAGHRYYSVFTLRSEDLTVMTHGEEWVPDKLLATLAIHYAGTKRGRVGAVGCHHIWEKVNDGWADPHTACKICKVRK